jgi:hypothetical protein
MAVVLNRTIQAPKDTVIIYPDHIAMLDFQRISTLTPHEQAEIEAYSQCTQRSLREQNTTIYLYLDSDKGKSTFFVRSAAEIDSLSSKSGNADLIAEYLNGLRLSSAAMGKSLSENEIGEEVVTLNLPSFFSAPPGRRRVNSLT